MSSLSVERRYCFTPAVRTCWPFGMLGVWFTLLLLVNAKLAMTMIYGLCTKSSRSLYDHVFKSLGRYNVVKGVINTLGVSLFMADRSMWAAFVHPRDFVIEGPFGFNTPTSSSIDQTIYSIYSTYSLRHRLHCDGYHPPLADLQERHACLPPQARWAGLLGCRHRRTHRGT